MATVPKEIENLNAEIHNENGHREKCLREYCRLKQMSRTKILSVYGDPITWNWEEPNE